ncbi:MAG: glycosyltransferase family 4 protein [Gemmataceae bacterium]
MSNPGPSYLVAMLGARMHYAVPRILHRENRLSRLLTDFSATQGVLGVLGHWPKGLRPRVLERLLNRTPKEVPPERIRAFTRLGIRYARAFARTNTELERVRLFLDVNRRFTEWVAQQDWAGATAVFGYNTAALEILQHARRQGLHGVVEQTIAPYAFERQLLADERNRYPNWEPDPGSAPEFDQFAEREGQEWDLADLVLCGSDFVRDSVIAYGGPAERCVVVPYGVDNRFDVPERAEHEGPLRVLTVGAAGLRKGTPYAVEAAKGLRGRAQFRWVGGLKLAESARNELGSDIEFTGMVPRSEVVKHYAWADVLLLPSLCEGSATSTYEALTSGLPVVCTPNCGSVVRDGAEGFIVPIRDPAAICARLDELASDVERRRMMGKLARARAAEFDFETYARNLLTALDRIEAQR